MSVTKLFPDPPAQLMEERIHSLLQGMAAIAPVDDVVKAAHAACARLKPPRIDPARAAMLDGEFDKAWGAWPVTGRRRSSKIKAKASFIKVCQQKGLESLTEAFARYLASDDARRDNGAYVPALERWLASGRWEAWAEADDDGRVGFV